MDVFALQEELDASKVARASQARVNMHKTNSGKEGQLSSRGENDVSLSSSGLASEDHGPPQLIRDDDCGIVMAAPALHPHSAEYKLRQRYFVFSDEIIGRGGFGEVLLAQLRDVPIIGKSTFIPISALLGPGVHTSNGESVSRAQQQVSTANTTIITTGGAGAGGGGNMPPLPLILHSAMSPIATGPGMNFLSTSAMSVGGISVHLPQALGGGGISNNNNTNLAGSAAMSFDAVREQLHSSPSSPSHSSSPAVPIFTAAAARQQHDIPLYAVKKIDKSRTSHKGLSQLLSEVETLSLLTHSNIVKLQEVFQDQKHMFIVMEYVRGGELGKVLKRVGHFSEMVARKVCLGILLAIEYIHEKGIVHRDLKPANCLLTKDTVFSSSTAFHFAQLHAVAMQSESAGASNNNKDLQLRRSISNNVSPLSSPVLQSPVLSSSSSQRGPALEFTTDDYAGLKIADFGFAAMVGRAECLTSYCGTMHFMAPEVAGREGTNYGKPVDLWSFGVIVYNLLSGDLPFSGATTEKLVDAIGAGIVSFGAHPKTGVNIWNRVSPQAKDFIQKLLVVDPNRRLTAQEALRHPWIRAEYTDEDLGDYPTTKGVLRAHSKFSKNRRIRHRLIGCCQAIIAAHRLVYHARLQAMRREGIAEIPSLRNFPFMVHGIFEPPNHVVSASSKRFSSNIPALKRLTEMVAASHTVEVLDVSGNNIDDLGLVQLIVKVSFAHPSLTHLNMERNPIPALAARALIRLARSPTHKLNIINVNHTSLGIDVIAQIDSNLKETIRKRAEAAAAANHSSMNGSAVHSSPIVASSSILRHDGNALRLGLMQSLTAAPSPSGSNSGGSSILGHWNGLSRQVVSPTRNAALSPSVMSPAAGQPNQYYRPPSVLSGTSSASAATPTMSASANMSSPMNHSYRSNGGNSFSPLARPSHGPATLMRRALQGSATLPPLQPHAAEVSMGVRLRAAAAAGGGDGRVATGTGVNAARTSAQRR
ncbi:protein kinase, putative [Bodo saltans]|uniref:Protein kinase, putative n=1 Tax=Bodo saltans TaxID=75058 RepID=A0A0S4JLM9_BODSA|nr:protein kinase, putative [Bodo saltans]|eukprot:CUG91091.1 protein kinase, putative [Bodo saltans]